jgi:protein-S-isoprenylcysteine O-methyltransferase Ste14
VSALLGLPLFCALFVFLPAGSWRWGRGWLFIAVFVVAMPCIAAYLWRVNPEVVIARSRRHEGTKAWDRVLLAFYFPLTYSTILVASLDAGRFRWLPLPWWVCAFGYVVLIAALWLVTWAESVNKFFEVTVRIQTDRGQTVVDKGPYSIVRHPGYVAGILMAFAFALCLGSLWALVPAAASACLLLLRTHWEDQTLQAELTGYREYAGRVRYRLLPGVW